MFFFIVLQFFVAAVMILLVLFQNSEDVVSDFTSPRTVQGSRSASASSPSKLTWFFASALFLNTILLGIIYPVSSNKRATLLQENSVKVKHETEAETKTLDEM